jgi:aspartyl-tRNA(Asn)/glutamyl-tRNA(Gln) amidotransferase subunit C
MSRIGRAEVERIGHLARLRLEPAEAEALARDLDAILVHVAELEGVDTAGVEPTSHVLPFATPLREDVPCASGARDPVLEVAPDRDGHAFLVPPVLEGEEEG